MAKKQLKIERLIAQIDQIIAQIKNIEEQYDSKLHRVHPKYAEYAVNLIHYRALRTLDIRDLQEQLGSIGLSRLGGINRHVLASLETNKQLLKSVLGKEKFTLPRFEFSFQDSEEQARRNTKALFGYQSKRRTTRIMVTLPSEAAENYKLVREMIKKGMNCARINCAHDDAEAWSKMVGHVKKASKALGKRCKIAMDLGGPKIRTGQIVPGPKVKKFRPVKDVKGQVIEPCMIWMGKEPPSEKELEYLPILIKKGAQIKKGDRLTFRDTRNKKREFVVVSAKKNGWLVHAFKTTFVETGMKLSINAKSNSSVKVGDLMPIELPLILKKGDLLRLHKSNDLAENANKKKKKIAHISCTLGSVFKSLKKGETIFFDDGKIETKIKEVNNKEAILEIMHAAEGGSKLKSDKGINFVSSQLNISGLTKKDIKDLEFVVKHADAVNFSFVDNAQDVSDLLIELERLKAPKNLGIILKIETQNGFNNLTKILLSAMQSYPVGVMIARGDLAIEVGWKNIARVQGEILSLCQSAGIPIVWATQVLEGLSKQGIPSRAEITDASLAQQADAVMLNKGPYILESIKLLNTILKDMDCYRKGDVPLMPKLAPAEVHKLGEEMINENGQTEELLKV